MGEIDKKEKSFRNSLIPGGAAVLGELIGLAILKSCTLDLHNVYILQSPATICVGENFANERTIPEKTYLIEISDPISIRTRDNYYYYLDKEGYLSEGRMQGLIDGNLIASVSSKELYSMDIVATVKDFEPSDSIKINIKENPNSSSETISTVHPGDSILIDGSKKRIDSKGIKYMYCIAFNEDGITYGWIPEETVEVTDTIEWNIP